MDDHDTKTIKVQLQLPPVNLRSVGNAVDTFFCWTVAVLIGLPIIFILFLIILSDFIH